MNLKGLLGGKTGTIGSGVLGVVIGIALSLWQGNDDLESVLARAKGEPEALLAAAAKKVCAVSSSAARLAAIEGARALLDPDQDISVTCTVEEEAAEAPDTEDIQGVADSVINQANDQQEQDEEEGQAEIVDTIEAPEQKEESQ